MGPVTAPFAPLLGNAELRSRLLDLANREHLHPCLIFEGPVGVGKASTARWLAATLNCGSSGARPCGTCWSCRQILRGQHPDILEIGLDPERTAPIISVEQTRKLVGQLALHPFHARVRVVTLDPADALSPEAANALLKTLEEPPGSTVFVLVTAAVSRLLPTVRSRGQRVRFAPVPEAELTPWLEARGLTDAAWLARESGGCPGRALALAEGEAALAIEARDELLRALAGPVEGMFSYAEALVKGERSDWLPRVERTLDALARLVRDTLVIGSGRQPLYNPDRAELVGAWASALHLDGARRVSLAIDAARRDLDGYVNARLLIEALLTGVAAELGRARQQGAPS